MDLPANLRTFDDANTTRSWLMENTLSALGNRFPIEDTDYKLELLNPRYSGSTKFGLDRQKKALLKDEQLKIPVKGTWRLTHKASGQVLDEREDTVMHLPYLTDRSTIIYGGNEYSTVNQSRLKPGVYARRKKSGEIESFYNVKAGTGRTMRVWLEPETGVFKVNIGQSNIPLFPLMDAMGVKQQDLVKAWGPEITAVNMGAKAPQALDKYYQRLLNKSPDTELSDDARKKAILEAIQKAELDENVVARTLGLKNTKNITPELILRSSQKLLNISKNIENPDDRDSPMFSNVLGVEDVIKERIEKDAGKTARQLLWRARRDKSLKRVYPGSLNPYIQGYMFGSRLTMPLEETNPLSLLEQSSRITKLGEGGIGDAEAITDEARNVNIGQLGFVDPITGPEGLNIGIDTRASYNTFKGKDGQMYAEFKDARSGKPLYLRPEDVDGKVIAFPGELGKDKTSVMAVVDGKIQETDPANVDLEIPSFAHIMSANTNLNPMPTSVQPARQFYGAKFWGQYMPQVEGETPLVDSVMDNGQSFSEYYGKRVGSISASKSGVVNKVTENGLHVTYEDGEKDVIDLVKDFPFNRITGISYYSKLEPGAAFNKGDMLAYSNFIDKDTGSLKLGRNLKTAIIPYRGQSYEDAYVISEEAAKKLATQRLYGFDQDSKHGVEINRNKFAAVFPDKFTKKQLGNIDKDGVVKPGSVLTYGDPIILAVGPKILTSEDAQLGKLHKTLRNAQTDKSLIWDHDYDGIVTDAVMTRKGAKVNVKASVPVRQGDKLSTRFGLKGVVGKVVPQNEMPRDPATDQAYDLLLNPMGILSRVAPNQLVEIQLGKLARRTGKQVRIPQLPPEEGWTDWALKQLEEAGIPDKEQIFDPETGRNLPAVGTGETYILPFHHLSEKKLSERGSTGVGYTLDELPAKGGEETQQAKRMSGMDITQLLAHGATEVVRDAQVIRGAKNEEFWKALKLGRPLPEPEVPFVYNKFLNTLKAGGINLTQKGDTLNLMPMTDDDVTKLSRGVVSSSRMLGSDLEPIAGGLFDPGITGGSLGKNWSHIDLVEPVPNPVFEEPVRRVLGLKKQELRDVVAGRKDINGKTGGYALKEALQGIDIDAEIEKHKENISKYKGSNRDNSIKILGYLTAAKKQNITPDSWMISKIPIIPPVFRPVSKLGDITLEADMNELYRDLIEVNSSISNLKKDLGESGLEEEKETLYDAVNAVMGLGDAITPEGRSRRLRGAIRTVIGDSPKTGYFQSRVLSKPVDLVGRGVVTPEPNYDMDSVGIPKDMAWKTYKDFVLRRLVRQNIPVHLALEMIESRNPQAQRALEDEMQYRPILMDRAPTWHKFNILAFNPHLVDGDTIRVSPLITKGFTMDFDGDAVNFHVPVSDKAVSQARDKMMPSKNLFSLTDLKSIRHSPQQEMALGLYMLTRKPTDKPPVKFKTIADAKLAYRRGEIGANDKIIID